MDPSFVRSKGYHWSAEVESALAFVDQGSVIRGVPMVYGANGAHAIMPETKVLGEATGVIRLPEGDAMVTTQTCDIRGPGSKKSPLLTVAPVYKLTALNPNMTVASVARSAYLAVTTGPAFADDAYVVDLRFETAVEKSIAVGRKVDDGFSAFEERSAFSKKLGEYKRRGAFDPHLEDALLLPLETAFNEAISPHDVYEVRVFGDPSISHATTVRLVVACEASANVDHVRTVMSAWYDDRRESLPELTLLPLIVKSVEELTVAEIRASVPFYFRHLSEGPPEA